MIIYISLFEVGILPIVNYKRYQLNFLFLLYDLVLIYGYMYEMYGGIYKDYLTMCFIVVIISTILYGIYLFAYRRRDITLIINTRNYRGQINEIQEYFIRNNILVEINSEQVNKSYVKLKNISTYEAKPIIKDIRLFLKTSYKFRYTNIFNIISFMLFILLTIYLFYLTF